MRNKRPCNLIQNQLGSARTSVSVCVCVPVSHLAHTRLWQQSCLYLRLRETEVGAGMCLGPPHSRWQDQLTGNSRLDARQPYCIAGLWINQVCSILPHTHRGKNYISGSFKKSLSADLATVCFGQLQSLSALLQVASSYNDLHTHTHTYTQSSWPINSLLGWVCDKWPPFQVQCQTPSPRHQSNQLQTKLQCITRDCVRGMEPWCACFPW